jgi:hypothetical protein
VPTIVGADNFTHQSFVGNLAAPPAAADRRIWSQGPGTWSSFDSGVTRDGRGSMKLAMDGTNAAHNVKNIPTTNKVLVFSVYIRATTTASVVTNMLMAVMPSNSGAIRADTSGVFSAQVGGGTVRTSTVSYTDGVWHRIDARFDSTGTTWTLDWAIDGVAQTAASLAGMVATDITGVRLGSATAQAAMDIWYQDLVWSFTSGDHPIGAHRVLTLLPNGDGTHNLSGVGDMDFDTTAISVTDAFGRTDVYTGINTWPANLGNFVEDLAGASTEYTEHTFEDISGSPTVWGAYGYAAASASTTTLCTITVRFVDSGGATVFNLLNDEDVSETTLRFWFGKVVDNPAASTVNGYKVRIGLSTDVAPDPRVDAVMLQYAIAGDPAVLPEVNMAPHRAP